MNQVLQMIRAGSVCLASAFMTASVVAAEQGGSEGTAAGNPHTNEIFKWINFAILAALLMWVCVKHLVPWFRKNAESIGAAISSAARLKAEAEGRLREAETKLANLPSETAKLREEAQREEEAEAQRIRAATQNDQQKVAAAATAEIPIFP